MLYGHLNPAVTSLFTMKFNRQFFIPIAVFRRGPSFHPAFALGSVVRRRRSARRKTSPAPNIQTGRRHRRTGFPITGSRAWVMKILLGAVQ